MTFADVAELNGLVARYNRARAQKDSDRALALRFILLNRFHVEVPTSPDAA